MLEHEGPAWVGEDEADPVCTGEHGSKVILAVLAIGFEDGLLAVVLFEHVGPNLYPAVYDAPLEAAVIPGITSITTSAASLPSSSLISNMSEAMP